MPTSASNATPASRWDLDHEHPRGRSTEAPTLGMDHVSAAWLNPDFGRHSVRGLEMDRMFTRVVPRIVLLGG